MRIFVLLIIWLITIVLLSYICFTTKYNDINGTAEQESIESSIEQNINNTDNSTINIEESINIVKNNLTKEDDDIKVIDNPLLEEINQSDNSEIEDINTKEVIINKIPLCQEKFNSILSKEKIYFDKNKFDIKSSSQATLDKLIEIFKECPNGRIVIAGYTDSMGSATTNRKISLKRANAVKNYFIKSGISSDRLEAVGYGEIKPIASNSTAEGREKNRRIEIYVEGVNDE
jgi:outer membrane protein OmpA-like peptidoglycan-associated protein